MTKEEKRVWVAEINGMCKAIALQVEAKDASAYLGENEDDAGKVFVDVFSWNAPGTNPPPIEVEINFRTILENCLERQHSLSYLKECAEGAGDGCEIKTWEVVGN